MTVKIEIWQVILGLILTTALFVAVWTFKSAYGADAEQEQHTDVAVSIAPIVRRDLHAYVTTYGIVEPEPAYAGKAPAGALVAAPSAGLVIESKCEEGQKVIKGQLLFGLDHRLVDVQLERARSVLTLAQKNLKRRLVLKQTDNVSQKLLDEAEQQVEAAGKDLELVQTQKELLRVYSPLAGTVVRINVRPGEVVSGNATLAEVIDLNRLIVNAQVPAAEALPLHPRQNAQLFVAADSASLNGSPAAQGRVSFIGLQVDLRNASVPVRITLEPGSGLRPGQYVQVKVSANTHLASLAVPLESVVRIDGKPAIFVRDHDWARLHWVTLGYIDGKFTEVIGDGLIEGMEVITSGSYGLTADTQIHLAASP